MMLTLKSLDTWVAPAIAAIGFALVVGVAIAAGNAFGYDESVYAIKARSWVSDLPASGWGIHRPPLLSILGLPAALLGGEEWMFRAIGLAFGLGTIAVVWRLARDAFGPRAAALAVLAVSVGSQFQVQSSTYLTDVGSAAILLILIWMLWRDVTHPGRGAFVRLAPVAALAFYLRYGALVPIGALGIAATLVMPQVVVRRWRRIVAAAAIFTVLLAPHFVQATIERGSPWGIITLAEGAAASQGRLPLVDYLLWLPWTLIGPLGGALCLLGLAAGATAVLGPRPNASDALLYVRLAFISAVVQLAVLGTVVHAEPRYVFFPVFTLIVLGSGVAASRLTASRHRHSVRFWAVAIPLTLLLLGAGTTYLEIADRATYWDWKRESATRIGAGDATCSAIASDVPIVSWYSGCEVYNFAVGTHSDRLALLSGQNQYVLIRTDGLNQPQGQELAARYLPYLSEVVIYTDGRGYQAATLYRVVR